MDFIVADKNRAEIGILQTSLLDFDIGNKNDFEITMDLDYWASTSYGYGCLVYANGTEYGGIIEDMKVDTKNNTIKLKGYTWRGLLTQKIIEPPGGSAYLTVTGEANAVISGVIGVLFGDLYTVDNVASGFNVNYQFYRYTTLLDGLVNMLQGVNAKLQIRFDNTDMMVHIQAVPIIDYSDELEYSQDNQISFITRDYRCGINHLICLGSGELANREVRHLYVQEDGSIGTEQFYTGIDERVAAYDYANAEDTNDLIENGTKRLNTLINYKELSMSIEEIDAELGDIVGGRERVTGLEMKKPITEKILKINGNNKKINFKVGD